MKTQTLKPLVFLVSSAMLIGFGLWSVTVNTINYFEDIGLINASKGFVVVNIVTAQTFVVLQEMNVQICT